MVKKEYDMRGKDLLSRVAIQIVNGETFVAEDRPDGGKQMQYHASVNFAKERVLV